MFNMNCYSYPLNFTQQQPCMSVPGTRVTLEQALGSWERSCGEDGFVDGPVRWPHGKEPKRALV